MLEFLLKQSLNDFIFCEDNEGIVALEKYSDDMDNVELESFVFEKLDLYISQNLLFFESLLFEKYWREDSDDKGVAKKVINLASRKKVVDIENYKNTKANVPKVEVKKTQEKKKKKKKKKKQSETKEQKAKRIAKSDINKLANSNIIKRKLGVIHLRKAIKDAVVKKVKSSKPAQKIKSAMAVQLKKVQDARRAAKQEFKKSSQAYEKYVNSKDMKDKREALRKAAKDKRSVKKRSFRRRALLFTAKRIR